MSRISDLYKHIYIRNHRSAIDFDRLAFPTVSWALMHYRMHREAAVKRLWQRGDQQQIDPALALWEPQAPFRNPVLRGHEGSTNVWYNPHKGGLVFDDSWLRRRMEE